LPNIDHKNGNVQIITSCFFLAYGALPMYFDLMGPHFVISIRSTLGEEWYEALVSAEKRLQASNSQHSKSFVT
jgi:hypothetical protein